MNSKRRMDLADLVLELTRPHQHREPYSARVKGTLFGLHHTTSVPPLIHQLRYAQPSSGGEERANRGYASRPAARIEALDTLVRIDLEASRWVRDLGEDDPTDTIEVIARLHGLLASADEETRKEVTRDVRRWWTQARITTGWDSPAWRPDNTCPLCAKRGGLRVKLADHAAFCVDCGETWTPETIALLADHIRSENAEDADQEVDAS